MVHFALEPCLQNHLQKRLMDLVQHSISAFHSVHCSSRRSKTRDMVPGVEGLCTDSTVPWYMRDKPISNQDGECTSQVTTSFQGQI